MSISPFYELQSNADARRVFREVARRRRISFTELEALDLDEATLLKALKVLQRIGVVAETSAAIPQLRTYYVTRDGLAAQRELGFVARAPRRVARLL